MEDEATSISGEIDSRQSTHLAKHVAKNGEGGSYLNPTKKSFSLLLIGVVDYS